MSEWQIGGAERARRAYSRVAWVTRLVVTSAVLKPLAFAPSSTVPHGFFSVSMPM